jgi:diguanylate cyclase (GGDEF)-like protein
MGTALIPPHEAQRLAALRAYDVLDKACWDSFDDITRLAATLTGSPTALVSLIDADRQWFMSRHGMALAETPRDQAFCAHAILDPSQPLVVPDATKDRRFSDNPLVTGAPDIRFYAGVPLISREGQALGTLCVIDQQPKKLEAHLIATLESLAQMVMTTLELRRAMHGARDVAMTDSLTGLPNRAAFQEAVGRAIDCHKPGGAPFSLLHIDLDNFKPVNDALGHQTGDEVLTAATAGLWTAVRSDDMPARIGGDEFAALLRGVDPVIVRQVGERVRASMEKHLGKLPSPVTASVGAVAFAIAPNSAEDAMAIADAAMYEAKRAGGNRVVFREYAEPVRVLEDMR